MTRILKFAYLSAFVLLVLTFALGQAAPKENPKGEEPLYVRLAKPITFNGVDDPKMTLAEVFDQLGAQHNIVFDINDKAFRADSLMDVCKIQVAEQNPLPQMKNVGLETVLRKILDRIPNQTGATFIIRRDRIEITTTKAQTDEFWPNAPEGMEPVFPLVHGKYDKKPLDEALKDLADRTEVTIILDPKAGEKAVVTAKLTNTPLDTAVQLLAEMCDLRAVTLGKTLFVTTAEKAKRMQPKQPKQLAVPMAPGGMLGVIGALGQMGVGPMPVAPPGFRPRSDNPGRGM